jgi:hypothetical protein
MNSPKRSRTVKTPVAGVTSVPAPKGDGENEAVKSGYFVSLYTPTARPPCQSPKVAESKRLPTVRSLAGVPLKDPKRKGPPKGTHLPHAARGGRIGASRSPWRLWNDSTKKLESKLSTSRTPAHGRKEVIGLSADDGPRLDSAGRVDDGGCDTVGASRR